MDHNKKIIIGSGLAGPLLAICLSQRDYSVKLFEKRSDPRINDISAGRSINLALSHRGIKALKHADVFTEVEPHLIPMKGRMIHHLSGKLEFQPYSIHSNEYINSVSRSELNKILMSKAEISGKVKIFFNHSLKKVDESKNKLIFENGNSTSISGHVFGADGAGSIIRKHIDEKVVSPSYSDALGHGYKELHIAPGKEGEFQLDPNALHIWPRSKFMLIALPNTDQSFTCTLFMPVKGNDSFDSLDTPDAITYFFQTYFKDVLPLLENFPETYFENPIGNLATVYADNWEYDNRFCLIGDAAHAIVPFFGQGMNASFEDCQIFMNCLDESNDNWDNIFNSYNTVRKIDADAIAQMAIENYIEMRDLVTREDFIQKKVISAQLSKQYPKRFIPRYNMVSFTSIPYSEVYKRGNIQKKIISKLDIDSPDFNSVKDMIHKQLTFLS